MGKSSKCEACGEEAVHVRTFHQVETSKAEIQLCKIHDRLMFLHGEAYMFMKFPFLLMRRKLKGKYIVKSIFN